ncbi:MAG TPA: hypothetical protein VFZ53_29005 [Polyangiaceae bacterium]
MTSERISDDDAALDDALGALPIPELPEGLRMRLEAIPARSNVRRFPLRKLGVSAFGWAAAAALGLFIGSQSVERDATGAGTASADAVVGAERSAEDETLELAVGSFAEFEEEP